MHDIGSGKIGWGFRSRTTCLLTICFLAIWQLVSSSPLHAETAKEINVSYSALDAAESPIWVATDLGFLRKVGFDVNLIYIVSGSTSIQTLISGDTQIAIAGSSGVVQGDVNGADIVYLGADIKSPEFYLITRPGITRPAQLKGKHIAIGRFGGSPDFTFRYILKYWGLTPMKDVVILQVPGGQTGRFGALQKGLIDGAIISPPLTLMAKKLGLNVMTEFSKIIKNYIVSGIAVRRDYAVQHDHLLQEFVKGYISAVRFMKANKEQTMKVIGKYMRVNDRAVLEDTYHEIVQKRLTSDLRATVGGLRLVAHALASRDPRVKSLDLKKIIYPKILNELKEEGFIHF